ncbi:hypothetical protein P43SY_009465 [Pythium insidiosum]|uniref:Bacterial Pleckstrin homology domain-containing protein n=1 Tax=Pythium insidiosum TaxID=114742 RepID=A0AAD5Q4B7_PYTIN|nr:hypothetical protein P43SY_009465 [Pythium insidiosum]
MNVLKGLTQDLTGSADICTTVTDFSKLLVWPYVLPGEDVLFAFQSPKEEFVFTNEALICVEGANATTTRKMIKRYEYRDEMITDVCFETTGRIDRDCEIKFKIGSEKISIDIARKEEERVKLYYKTLVALAREQEQRRRSWKFERDSLDTSATATKLSKLLAISGKSSPDAADPSLLTKQASEVYRWLETDHERINPRCFKAVIQKGLQSA